MYCASGCSRVCTPVGLPTGVRCTDCENFHPLEADSPPMVDLAELLASSEGSEEEGEDDQNERAPENRHTGLFDQGGSSLGSLLRSAREEQRAASSHDQSSRAQSASASVVTVLEPAAMTPAATASATEREGTASRSTEEVEPSATERRTPEGPAPVVPPTTTVNAGTASPGLSAVAPAADPLIPSVSTPAALPLVMDRIPGAAAASPAPSPVAPEPPRTGRGRGAAGRGAAPLNQAASRGRGAGRGNPQQTLITQRGRPRAPQAPGNN